MVVPAHSDAQLDTQKARRCDVEAACSMRRHESDATLAQRPRRDVEAAHSDVQLDTEKTG